MRTTDHNDEAIKLCADAPAMRADDLRSELIHPVRTSGRRAPACLVRLGVTPA
jgi:hypothetical protein